MRSAGPLLAFGMSAVASCGGRAADPVVVAPPDEPPATNPLPPSPPSVDSGTASRLCTVDGGFSGPPRGGPGNCAAPGTERAIADIQAFRLLFTRRWALCSVTGVGLAAAGAEAGFEAYADGTYRLLERDASGGLAPSGDPCAHGKLEILPLNTNVFQVEFDIADQNFASGPWVVYATDRPRQLVMVGGAYHAEFVPESTEGWPEGDGGAGDGGDAGD